MQARTIGGCERDWLIFDAGVARSDGLSGNRKER
jgi:hypothetical protein